MNLYRSALLDSLVRTLKEDPSALALWECGSAATGTTDQFSDIDLRIIADTEPNLLFEKIEKSIGGISPITHKLVESNSFWPGLSQRVYFTKDAPRHFFIDIGILKKEFTETLDELLLEERHGAPVVHFDKTAMVKPHKQDLQKLRQKQRTRLAELEAVFPVYVTEVLKSLDRGHSIDAFAFYFGGLVKPLVEVMGMAYRPHRFDFGLRYLHRDFPLHQQEALKSLLYERNEENLREAVHEAEKLFQNAVSKVQQLLF